MCVFAFMYVYATCALVPVYVTAFSEGQERVFDSLVLELGKSGSSAKVARAHNCRAISPASSVDDFIPSYL